MLNDGECGEFAAIQREIDSLNQALGDAPLVEDDLIDKWERQLENGETPNLEEGLDFG